MAHSPLRVAHVDDDDDLLAIVRFALEATADMQVESFASGGLETIARLREKMDMSHVAVAFATGLEDPDQLRRISESGAVAIIHKPFDAFALADRIQRIAPR